MKKIILYLFVFSVLISGCQPAANQSAGGVKNTGMVQAVIAFRDALTPDQLKKASYNFEDEQRFKWFFVPIERIGLPLKEMNESQRKLAMAILQTALSNQGYSKAKSIMEMEVLLKALEKLPPENERRDPTKYYFTLFGDPAGINPWGWRVEGHHLSLNFSSVSGRVVAETPAFMGSNPAIVPEGPDKGRQILKQEADLGFALVNSFSTDQLQKALIAEVAPNEIVTTNVRKAMIAKPEGILYNELTPDQKKVFNQLLSTYLDNYQPDLAQDLRAKMTKAGMDQMRFAWAGVREQAVTGKAHYYRIHNPVLLIEYDNSQNDANHVHTVIRDLTNDFGEDALQQHYKKQKH